MNVLLVEPDAILSRVYSQALEASDFKVITANSAQKALDKIVDRKPDIVVLEPQLTSHSGIEFLYELRSYKDWQDIPVIILSLVPEYEFQTSRNMLFSKLKVAKYLEKNDKSILDLIKTINNILIK